LKLIVSFFKSRRLWGLTGTGLVLYFVVFVVFGKVNLNGIMPDTDQIARTLIEVWPKLPFFTVEKMPINGGKGQEVYYTVPTRQLTPQELAQMGVTNATPPPAQPKK
jgi:hypothetical protein